MFDVLTDLLSKDDEKLVPVHDDPAVSAAAEALVQATARKDELEAEEKRLLRLATGKVDHYTDEELAEARERLAIRKGTQTGWYLPEAEQARAEVAKRSQEMQTAVEPARRRLFAAGEAKMARQIGRAHV